MEFKLLNKILNNLDERSLRAYKNLFVSFNAKFLSLAITFIMVPIALNYVGKAEYGVWLTISSIITWFTYFDIGLGNGLRTKLAIAIAQNDLKRAKVYISSAYFLISAISITLFLLFISFASLVSWNDLLNTYFIDNEQLFKIVIIVFFFFCLSFCLKTVTSILEALQLYAIKDIVSVATQLFGLVAILVIVEYTDGSLLYLSIVYGGQTTVGLVIASFVLFTGKLKYLRPSVSNIKIKESLPLINLGVWFFLNQILYLVSTQISIFLVVQLFGPEDVTVYNLANNYMSLSPMLFIMILTPFLSAFTEAYTKKEYQWITLTIKKIMIAFICACLVIAIMIISYRVFFNLWVSGKVMPDILLIIMLGFFGVLQMFASVYTLFLNSIGKIRLQFFTLLCSAFFFVPLVLLFHKLNLGLSSLVIPGIIFGMINSYIYRKQYNLVMQSKANGIWNK